MMVYSVRIGEGSERPFRVRVLGTICLLLNSLVMHGLYTLSLHLWDTIRYIIPTLNLCGKVIQLDARLFVILMVCLDEGKGYLKETNAMNFLLFGWKKMGRKLVSFSLRIQISDFFPFLGIES